MSVSQSLALSSSEVRPTTRRSSCLVQGGLGSPIQVQGLLSVSLTSVATLKGMTFFFLLPLLAAAQISSLPTLLIFYLKF